jgi:hypothetical protein
MDDEYAGKKSAAEQRKEKRKVTLARGTSQDGKSFTM